VLKGDSTDEDLLERRERAGVDLFLALTSDDEDNIMACLLAKRMGARRVLALINRKAYADLVQGTQIDIAISPSQAVIGELLAMCGAATWRRCTACAAARRGAGGGGARRPQDLQGGGPAHRGDPLPAGAQIGAIVRGCTATAATTNPPSRVIIPHHDTEIDRRPRHRLRAAQAHGAPGREAVPGQRDLLSDERPRDLASLAPSAAVRGLPAMNRLAVVALVGRMVALFALLMLVPLAFALVRPRRGRARLHDRPSASPLLAGMLMSLATRRFRRELQPRDGFLLVA
jgi:hypothetical protein